jgi:hypothetical protein
MGIEKTRMPTEMQTGKARLMKFPIGKRILVGIKVESFILAK